MKWTCGWASASRVKASLQWPISVCVARRNLRRTGVLKNRLRTSIVVPTGQPQGDDLARHAADHFQLAAGVALGLPAADARAG